MCLQSVLTLHLVPVSSVKANQYSHPQGRTQLHISLLHLVVARVRAIDSSYFYSPGFGHFCFQDMTSIDPETKSSHDAQTLRNTEKEELEQEEAVRGGNRGVQAAEDSRT